MAKILIVDDEPRIRELIRENLQYLRDLFNSVELKDIIKIGRAHV